MKTTAIVAIVLLVGAATVSAQGASSRSAAGASIGLGPGVQVDSGVATRAALGVSSASSHSSAAFKATPEVNGQLSLDAQADAGTQFSSRVDDLEAFIQARPGLLWQLRGIRPGNRFGFGLQNTEEAAAQAELSSLFQQRLSLQGDMDANADAIASIDARIVEIQGDIEGFDEVRSELVESRLETTLGAGPEFGTEAETEIDVEADIEATPE